jgi:hypothetical protein
VPESCRPSPGSQDAVTGRLPGFSHVVCFAGYGRCGGRPAALSLHLDSRIIVGPLKWLVNRNRQMERLDNPVTLILRRPFCSRWNATSPARRVGGHRWRAVDQLCFEASNRLYQRHALQPVPRSGGLRAPARGTCQACLPFELRRMLLPARSRNYRADDESACVE